MLTRRRVLVVVAVVVLAAIAYSAYLTLRTERDLRTAQDSVEALQTAVENDDTAARDQALSDLDESSTSAADHTDGLWWAAMTKVPFVGDDASGVEALSRSISTVTDQALTPLLGVVDDLDGVTRGGRIDLDAVSSLQAPVSQAAAGLTRASDLVAEKDSSGYVGPLRSRFDAYVDTVGGLERGLGSAETAVDLAPGMLGSDGPRDYLLIFQNNAEIRATAGLPGSWALLHADDGKLEIREQGSASDFPVLNQPVAELTDEETALYGTEIGRFFQDPNFTPDWPRAAELFDAFWQIDHADTPLDGVISLDVAALSYILEGTGPVQSGDLSITADNAEQLLLNQIYLDNDNPADQDRIFAQAARDIFEATTGDLASPIAFAEGLARAGREGRFLVSSFEGAEADKLSGTRVEGSVLSADTDAPKVFIGLNDATGSKMSYYLRYWSDVTSQSCTDGVQSLSGTMNLRQTISPSDAADLPRYITGGGALGTDAGQQFVAVRIYGPTGGTVADVRVDGKNVGAAKNQLIDGRPVVTLPTLLSSTNDVVITWKMTSGEGQTGAGSLRSTPGVVPGTQDRTFASSC